MEEMVLLPAERQEAIQRRLPVQAGARSLQQEMLDEGRSKMGSDGLQSGSVRNPRLQECGAMSCGMSRAGACLRDGVRSLFQSVRRSLRAQGRPRNGGMQLV